MYCSLVMADEGTTDGLTLFLSYFTGDTNELYMLNLMQSSDGLYFDATDVGNVGDSVWPATVNRVYGNASIKGIQTAEAAAEKNDIELTAQTVSAEKIERSTQEASAASTRFRCRSSCRAARRCREGRLHDRQRRCGPDPDGRRDHDEWPA